MKKNYAGILFFSVFLFSAEELFSQNVAVNITGTVAASTNLFEVTQASTTNNTVGIFAAHTGAATNAYAIWAAATGGTNKYALVVPSGGGNVGIGTIAPATLLSIEGIHGTTQARLTLPAAANGLGTGDVNLQLWVSEPGVTWDAAGIGTNVTNNGGSPAGFGRISALLGQSYIRFVTNGGAMAFNTTDNAGNYYQTMYMIGGNVGIGTTNPLGSLHVSSATYNLFDRGSNLNPSHLLLRSCKGTIASPSAILDVDGIGILSFGGYDGTAWTLLSQPAYISAKATQNWSATAHGSSITFATTPNSTTSPQERMIVDQNGNVGINTTAAPSAKLEVNGDIKLINTQGSILWSNVALRDFDIFQSATSPNRAFTVHSGANAGSGAGNIVIDFYGNDGAGNAVNGFTMLKNSNIGIGSTAPNRKLDIMTIGMDGITFGQQADNTQSIQTYIDGQWSNRVTYAGGCCNVLALQPDVGTVGIGTISPGGQFELSLDQGRKPGTNAWTIVSDERLKNIEGGYAKGLKEVLLLNPIAYYYKNADERKFPAEVLKTRNVGFSAQEVQKIFPECVGVDNDGYLNFNMHAILVAYANAFKEQQQMIKDLEFTVRNLQTENNIIRSEYDSRLKKLEKMLSEQAGK